ncbi:unnamed protein product, partial [Nesidiocoris tenuis]
MTHQFYSESLPEQVFVSPSAVVYSQCKLILTNSVATLMRNIKKHTMPILKPKNRTRPVTDP